jgi:signal transduction histidine kinase
VALIGEVAVTAHEGILDIRVSDDGAGGADQAKGSGIMGLRDRVEALGGTVAVASPLGGGTTIRAELPLAEPEGSPAM